MHLNKKEIFGGIVGFIPVASSFAGLIKVFYYFNKSKKINKAIENEKVATITTAKKLNDVTFQEFKMLKAYHYEKLWKLAIVETIPGINIITAIFSAIHLSLLSDVRNEMSLHSQTTSSEVVSSEVVSSEVVSSEVVSSEVVSSEVVSKELESKAIPQAPKIEGPRSRFEKAPVFKSSFSNQKKPILASNLIKRYESKSLTKHQKITFCEDLKEVLKNSSKSLERQELKRLKEIKEELSNEFAKALPENLNSVLENCESELKQHLDSLEVLKYPLESTSVDHSIENFIKDFESKSMARLDAINFSLVNIGAARNLIVEIEVVNDFRSPMDNEIESKIKDLKKILADQIAFFGSLKESLEYSSLMENALFHPSQLKLKEPLDSTTLVDNSLKRIPWEYNYDAEVYFNKHQAEWEKFFDAPAFPVQIWDPSQPRMIEIANLDDDRNRSKFFKLKDNYQSAIKTNKQMADIEPDNYPIMMPNLFYEDGKPSIEIKNSVEFRKLISCYSTYMGKRDKAIDRLRLTITEKIKIFNGLNL